MKGSIVIKRRQLLNMIDNNLAIFSSDISKESKLFTWGMLTAFQDILEGQGGEYNHDEFMQDLLEVPGCPGEYWIVNGLNFVLGKGEY